MKRTTVYLTDEQLGLLGALAERRGTSVAELVRNAVDALLSPQGVRKLDEDEWQRRVDSLLARRRKVARARKPSPERVERDVATAVREVRKTRTARRR
jgi:hypothetical protein